MNIISINSINYINFFNQPKLCIITTEGSLLVANEYHIVEYKGQESLFVKYEYKYTWDHFKDDVKAYFDEFIGICSVFKFW